jgi:hypothetical protein
VFSAVTCLESGFAFCLNFRETGNGTERTGNRGKCAEAEAGLEGAWQRAIVLSQL